MFLTVTNVTKIVGPALFVRMENTCMIVQKTAVTVASTLVFQLCVTSKTAYVNWAVPVNYFTGRRVNLIATPLAPERNVTG